MSEESNLSSLTNVKFDFNNNNLNVSVLTVSVQVFVLSGIALLELIICNLPQTLLS